MKEWIFLIYEYAAVILPGVVGLWWMRRKGFAEIKGRLTWCLTAAFMLYIGMVAEVTGMGSLASAIWFGLDTWGINLVPFSQEIDIVGYALNIIMLMPFGFLYSSLKRGAGFAETTLCGLGVSLFIEVSQLFCARATDVDDLICNTVGAAMGYLVFRVFAKIFKWQPNGDAKPMLLAMIMLIGRFIIYDGMGVAGWLYGF